ncbi:hypothetical protein ACKC9G_14535 [Pokkaliibacter sp. CJK22405]|uniref:hypothetical protein n=1 Tax=Pokkaliibacter sp. CJK22405 TaxID=3384615 RepID=UPI00398540AC
MEGIPTNRIISNDMLNTELAATDHTASENLRLNYTITETESGYVLEYCGVTKSFDAVDYVGFIKDQEIAREAAMRFAWHAAHAAGKLLVA